MPIRIVTLALCAFLLVAVPAQAGGPGSWTQLGDANLQNLDEATLARTPDGNLHVVWTIPASNNDTLVHAGVSPAGSASPLTTIQSGWAGINGEPKLIAVPGGLRVFFGGIRTINQGETNDNLNTATAGPDGASWTLTPGNVAKSDSAYASDQGAALLPDGTPIEVWGGTGSGVFVHRGLDPNTPNFPLQGQLGSCCGYQPDVAVDTKNGSTFVAWYSNANDKFGLFAQSLDPGTGAPSGAPALMPGSVTTFNGGPASAPQLGRTPIVARAGGGVYVAYATGYPTLNQVRLWRIADSKSAVIGQSKSGHLASIAADPEGRLWVFWVESSTTQIFARRSNKLATKFGPPVKIKAPKGQQTAFKLDGNAQSGPLDIVVLFQGPAGHAQWHTQILPGLDLAAPSKIKAKNKASAVTFTVTDPEPVKGAKVNAGGKSATTNAAGKATITLGPTKAKKITASVTKAGYTKGTKKIKVK